MLKNSIKRTLSVLLAGILSSNICLASASASDLNNQSTMYEKTGLMSSASYVTEMHELGLNDYEINRVASITNELGSLSRSRSVSDLMKEYHSIMDDTLASRSKTITSQLGGTLYLDYTGSINPLGDVIYQKVVYFNAEQTAFFESTMISTSLTDILVDVIKSNSSDVFTNALVKEIGAVFGISAPTWLVGSATSVVLALIESMDMMDLSDAVQRSTTGKIYLEYFYSVNSSFPYYMNLQNFEPWNNNTVVVPDDYDYTWSTAVYDYEPI